MVLSKIKNLIPLSKRIEFNQMIWEIKNSNSGKVFGIGHNKTGTTSLEIAMKNLGYKVGNQRKAEILHHKYWAKRDFKPIIKYCKTADFFQDAPFSHPFTFIALDQAFKHSKFILTVRDSPEQWYESMVKFHGKLWGQNEKVPTKKDLQNATYIYKGRPWDMNRLSFNTPEENPYQKDILIKYYIDYNNSVVEYFRHRPEDLLILNVAATGAYKKLCAFLDKPFIDKEFPWENKT